MAERNPFVTHTGINQRRVEQMRLAFYTI